MGRTIPSFTLALAEEESEWKAFRKCLDRSDRGIFDEMFAVPKLYVSMCMSCASPIVMDPVVMSLLFHHYKQLVLLAGRLEAAGGCFDAIPA